MSIVSRDVDSYRFVHTTDNLSCGLTRLVMCQATYRGSWCAAMFCLFKGQSSTILVACLEQQQTLGKLNLNNIAAAYFRSSVPRS